MWIYEKKLEYPVKIKSTNPALAKIIIAQYGGSHLDNYVNNLSNSVEHCIFVKHLI